MHLILFQMQHVQESIVKTNRFYRKTDICATIPADKNKLLKRSLRFIVTNIDLFLPDNGCVSLFVNGFHSMNNCKCIINTNY